MSKELPSAWSIWACALMSCACAMFTDSWMSEGSTSKRSSPFLTSSPTFLWTASTVPATFGKTLTSSSGSTVPMNSVLRERSPVSAVTVST